MLINTIHTHTHTHTHTLESGYNDIGLCDTLPLASDILWYQLIPYLLTITLHSLAITTFVYNDRKYSVPFMTL
jgi:hypothetical protein